jgi:hypothetical protein
VSGLRVTQRCTCALIAVLAMLMISCGAAFAAPRTVPFGFFGVTLDPQIPQYSSPAALNAQMGLMASSGIESVRANFFWPSIEPGPGSYTWAATDQLVHTAATHGLQLLPIIEYTPPWASSHHGAQSALYAPAHVSTFAAFVSALVQRYGPRGSFWRLPGNHGLNDPIVDWQIWNEPAGTWDWRSKPWDKTYGALLAAGYRAIHRADRHAVVVSGALVGATGGRTPWGEATALYRHGLSRYSDAIAVNAYTGAPSASNSVARSLKNRAVPAPGDELPGDAAKPIWVTEMTWSAGLGKLHRQDYIDIETTPRGQAQRLALYYKTVAQHRPWGIQRAFWYTWGSEYQRTFAFGIAATFQFTGLGEWRYTVPFTPLPLLSTYAASAAKFEGCRKSSNARTCRSG